MWSRVPWTEASQILAVLDGDDADGLAPAGQNPKGYFDGLVADGALERGDQLSGHCAAPARGRALVVGRAAGAGPDHRQ